MNKENRRRFLSRLAMGTLLASALKNRQKPSYDLLIVGAGSAGMTCAIAAAESGLRVMVVEKDIKIGGTLNITAGQMSAAGTRLQKAKGIQDSPHKHYEEIMQLSQHTADPSITRLAVEEAPRLIDWLETLGYPVAEQAPAIVYNHPPYRLARTYWGTMDYNPANPNEDAGRSVLKTLLPVWEKWQRAGRIHLRLGTSMESLIYHGGKVNGIVAQGNDGSKIDLKARQVVLATGGYAANPEFFQQVTPNAQRLVSGARITSQGEGIKAALQIGAAFHNAEKQGYTVGGIELQPFSGRADFWAAWARISTPLVRPPREIYLNAHGKRFMAEDQPDVTLRERAIAAQPHRQCWIIFDHYAFTAGAPLIFPWTVEEMQQEAEKERCLWKANTLEELAAKTKLPAENFLQTIADYNGAVAKGVDEQLGRKNLQFPVSTPPFYALLTYGFCLVSAGGLRTNPHLQVLNDSGKPIQGLYAVGEILGAGVTTGNVFCSGMLLTPALALGRWLGKKLAREKM
ncbi:MAG: FAD-dependent oxidoreductase [Cytophagales bacterium]|nr:FAD-dependent oxidoreductase [Bernardetiaceae bacterium]MDW8210854.1 FAD-dependent oxidoreductase [Cytophagales bacterium]